MNYLKKTLLNTWEFLRNTQAYFRDVLLMHGFILFGLLPLLSSSTKFILKRGNISYLSNENIGEILTQHPAVALLLGLTLLFILLAVFFEFTFLLLSVYFIQQKEAVSLKQLLKMTLLQMKKIRPSVILFFIFYFLLVLPIGGLNFNSDLLSRIKLPAFIMDFIFTNRLWVVSAFILGYLILVYLGIRVIFALPEMILRDRSFGAAVKESWEVTQRRFFSIIGRFLFIIGSILLITTAGTTLVIALQAGVEHFLPDQALNTAIFAMTFLQFFFLLNLVLSTVGIFAIIVDYMADEGFLPAIPKWFYREPLKPVSHRHLKNSLMVALAIFFGIGVSIYNMNYLTNMSQKIPITASHRGVSDKNGVQNSLQALTATHNHYHPDYIEMDVQLTKDKQFLVAHDFNLARLTGQALRPEEATLAESLALTVTENGKQAPLVSFDDYLATAETLQQKLIVEIKLKKADPVEIATLFVNRYGSRLQADGSLVQSLSYPVVEEVKTLTPNLTVGYTLPFNIVGPPVTKADFLTMEYSTINRNFIESAENDGKQVFVWTPNSEDDISRMMFYGVDGIITDSMATLNRVIEQRQDQTTYSDKLLNFVIGIG
ncbi:glycerophosphoryl diester phosphodiesterase membrane domain-containing protein [Enterococcus diestrammenae]|uniref:glycerophosphoryl diester phosphodiesterase membrane domain-containing protein n=1 Tax=Enterococcus diestrammenae TaxID=1155073 RepID=UPI00195AC7CE